ncbi:hypothetical protein IIA16_03770, partial [bacterium]|nr:hypothetical protein [bacterium]
MIILLTGDPFLVGEERRRRRGEAGVLDPMPVSARDALADDLAAVETMLCQGAMFGPEPWLETTDLYAFLQGLAARGATAARTRFARLLSMTGEATWLLSAEAAGRRGARRFAKPADVAKFAADPEALLGVAAS